jgi:hypothetical protein
MHREITKCGMQTRCYLLSTFTFDWTMLSVAPSIEPWDHGQMMTETGCVIGRHDGSVHEPISYTFAIPKCLLSTVSKPIDFEQIWGGKQK